MNRKIQFMKIKNLLVAVVLMTQVQTLFSQKDQFSKMPLAVKKITEQMVLIEGKTIIMNNVESAEITASDSTLIGLALKKRVTNSAFYISKTEVTNLEYRNFCKDMEKNLGKMAAKFLPDTLIWIQEFPYSYFNPMVGHYFRHPAYDNYQVVGVSWEQANAYCNWLSEKVNVELKAAGKTLLPNFRLPTEAEWEAAAMGKNVKLSDNQPFVRFGWGSSMLRDKNGLLLGNFRFLPDRNGFVLDVQDFSDNTSITAPSESYPPNSYGIYNMSGNVSEWVMDVLYLGIPGIKDDELLNAFRENSSADAKEKPDFSRIFDFYKEKGLQAAADFMLNEMKRLKLNEHLFSEADLSNYKKQILIPFVTDYVRFAQKNIPEDNSFRIVKGGSWFDGPYSLQIGSRHCMQQQKSSARIGFRLAMNKI